MTSFVIDGINGEYQRVQEIFYPFIFLFIHLLLYFSLVEASSREDNLLKHCRHYAAYILGYLVTLVISQLIGSNSASAVVFVLSNIYSFGNCPAA